MWPEDTPRPENNPYTFKYTYTMKQEQIQNFLNDLHKQQLDMIEAVVAQKEAQGFPEATVLINHIMGLK